MTVNVDCVVFYTTAILITSSIKEKRKNTSFPTNSRIAQVEPVYSKQPQEK